MRASRLPAAALVAAAVAAAVPAGDGCAPGLYVIVARGSTEPAGTGVTGILADQVAGRVEGSRVVPLDYPATLTKPVYQESEDDGVLAMHGAVEQYVRACPDSKLAIMAYSQGAQVSLDVVCGGASDAAVKPPPPLPASLVQGNVVAMVLFGDPTQTANATYNRGTSVDKGIFKRELSSLRVCDRYADRLVSFCDKGDIYCDASVDRAMHTSYVSRYGDQAVQFVVDRYRDAVGPHAGCGNVTASPSTPFSTPSSAPSSAPSSTTSTRPSASAPAASGAPGAAVSLALSLAAVVALLRVL